MSANQSRGLLELSARNAFNNRSCCCGGGAGIYDVSCFYEDGVFRLFCLPKCMPEIFTVRFTAPADFAADSVFKWDGDDFTAMGVDMKVAEDGVFAAGAVVTAEIDTCRKLAFIASGVAATGDPGECGCEGNGELLPDSEIVYYVDLNGDNSPLTPGTAEAPFKSLMGAVKAICRRRPPSVYAGITISINEGEYPEEDCRVRNWYPGTLTITGTAASPTLNGPDGLIVSDMPSVIVRNLKIASPTTCISTPRSNARLVDVEVIATGSGGKLVNIAHQAYTSIESLVVNNASGQIQNVILYVNRLSELYLLPQSTVHFANTITTNGGTFAIQYNSHAAVDGASFVNAANVKGPRYQLLRMGVLNAFGKGANSIPGSSAGIIASGAGYFL